MGTLPLFQYALVLYVCLCESIGIPYPLYLLLKTSFQSEGVREEFATRLKYPYLLNVFLNLSRTVQRHIDREFFINLGTVFLFWSQWGEKVTLVARALLLFVSHTFLNGITWKNTIFSDCVNNLLLFDLHLWTSWIYFQDFFFSPQNPEITAAFTYSSVSSGINKWISTNNLAMLITNGYSTKCLLC